MMDALERWILSGEAMTLIFGFIMAEFVLLAIVRWRTGRGIPVGRLVSLILPGLCIFLALRSALLDEGWQMIALWLLASFAAHMNDVRTRWRESTAQQKGEA